MALEVLPATAERFDDVATLLGRSAPALEGYPIDPAGARVSTAFAYVGTTSMFEAAGFHRVVQTAARSASLPRWLMRRTF